MTIVLCIESAQAAPSPGMLLGLDSKKNQKNLTDQQTKKATPEEIKAELKLKLNEVKAQRERLDGNDESIKAPEGVKKVEIIEQRRLIDSLIFFFQEGLNLLAAIETEQEKLKTIQAQSRDWTGFPDPPPYSMLMLYGLQEEADTLRGKQAVLESSLAGWRNDSPSLQAEVSRAQAAARLAAENVERATDPTEGLLAVWRRDNADLRTRAAERNIWLKDIQTGLINVKLDVVKAELELLDKKIKQARQHAVLSEADMAKVHESLKTTANNLEEEKQKAVADKTRWTEERETVARTLDQTRAEIQKGGAGNQDPLKIEALEANLRAADAWVTATNQEIESLATLAAINSNVGEFWNYQYTLQNSTDPKLRQNALNQLERDVARLRQWGSYTQDNLMLAVNEEHNQQAKLDSISVDSPLRRYEEKSIEAYRLKRQNAERVRLLTDRMQHLLERWLEDYRQGFWDKPIDQRFKERFQEAADLAVQIYRFEIFTVEDEVDLDGKKITITRGVTLGKLLTSCLVFLFGFWLVKWVSFRFQRVLVKRFDIDEAQSNVLRRWLLMGLSMLLLGMVLTWARIPLTAFAFLGGALAIGIGFGTQTMLKNLISGVMILAEHKIKVGDIVEVDSIVGTITEIDIRSSTVRGFDGVETMIPNSTFLENKVTNWTYTSLKIRRCVRVGVAYDSNVREVIQLMLDCAHRHGQVLDEPTPFVWLEEFGNDALNFGLYFWLEMGPKVSSQQIMSDLRCMLIDALRKSGVSIPFPQRDIHFDSSQPLPVSVVSTAKTDS